MSIFTMLSCISCDFVVAGEYDDRSDVYLAALQKNPKDISSHKFLYAVYMKKGDYGKALEYAKSMLSISEESGEESLEMLSYSYIGQAFFGRGNLDSALMSFDSGLKLWEAKDSLERTDDDYESVFTILNALGMYAVDIELNYEKGIDYFLRGLSLAVQRRADYNYAILGSNLVTTYYKRKDTSGMKYALDIYNYGKENGDEYVYYVGANVTALMYYLKGDFISAQKYIRQIISMSRMYFNTPGVYCLYANILSESGDNVEAEKYFKKAIGIAGNASSASAAEIYMSYGKFLLDLGQTEKAEGLFQQGIEICEEGKTRVYKSELLGLLSLAQEKEKEYRKALDTYKRYHVESYDIFNIESERAINDLQRRYENERHEREIQQSNAVIAKKKRELHISTLIIVFIVVCLIITCHMYRNKDRMYTKIAKQYKEALKQRMLQEKHSEDKNSELFTKLEEMMKVQKLYREKNLTRERAAEIIGSNRTYLSQMINEKAGMSFVHYVNNYRLNEAIEILSDPENTIPMKALSSDLGFSSPSTFYKLFQEKVGMSPAKYREKIIELSRNGN